jgi:chromosomal replication initiation ATPase DnaA
VRIWQARSGAGVIAAGDMSTKAEPKLPLAIEDFDTAPVNEAAIFHALNAAKEHSSYILLTGRTAPGHWKIDLPDLRSRIRSFPAITISQPDDQLIAAIYLKHFSDRQLAIAPDVIPFLMPRVDRSMAAIKATVEEIDRAALAEHRSITRAFVAKLMKTKTEKTQD